MQIRRAYSNLKHHPQFFFFFLSKTKANKDRILVRKEEGYQYWESHRPISETFLLQSGPPQRTGPTVAFHRTPGRDLFLLLHGRIWRSFELHFQWVLIVGHWGGEWVSETAGVSDFRALQVPLRPSCPTSSLFPLAEREEREVVIRFGVERG